MRKCMDCDANFLQELKSIIETLQANLPKEVSLLVCHDSSKGKIDPARAMMLREAIYHRITESAESLYVTLSKKHLIASCLLLRSIIETLALFNKFRNELKIFIKTKKLDDVRDFLHRTLAGVKSKKLRNMNV